MTLADRHALALAGIRRANTMGNLDQWAAWGKKFPFDGAQADELNDAYQERKAKLETRPT